MAFVLDTTQPEPLGIYQCTRCDYIVLNETFLIDDGENSITYSDGMRQTDYSDDYPMLTRCEKCNEIFWMREDSLIAEIPWSKDLDDKYMHVEAAKPLQLFELIQCVQNDFYDTVDEELYLRTRLMWRFNDRLRNRHPLYYSKIEKDTWYANLEDFKKILHFNDYSDRIMLAEIERYYGRYKVAIDILDTFPYVDMMWLRDKFINQCKLKNPEVFRIL